MIRKIGLALAACALLLGGPVLAEEIKEIRFGIISTESTQNLKKAWDPFLADMGKKLGMKVSGFFAPDYAGIIEAMRFDKVELAWYGNKSAMEAVDRAGAEIFVQTVDVKGNPGYWSLLLTHKDSPLKTLEDVFSRASELSFGNGDPNSTSGFLVPGYYLFAKNGIDPKKAFKRVVSANHETNALAVANKQVDIATNNTENLERIKTNFPEKYEQIRVIWKSPLIPSDPLAWRKNLPEDFKEKIRVFFLDYGVKGADAEQEKAILSALQWAPFRASSNDQLLPIRQLALFSNRAKIENDEKLSAAEKQTKLEEIDAQLAELDQRMAKLDNQ
jgi:phosphonate transport system substrate-binding protein